VQKRKHLYVRIARLADYKPHTALDEHKAFFASSKEYDGLEAAMNGLMCL